MAESLAPLMEQLDAVDERLTGLAQRPYPPGKTDPDPGGEETWDSARVWAHMGEFLPYWCTQARAVVDAPAGSTLEFGRMKTDPARVDRIERDRLLPPDQLWDHVYDGIEQSRNVFESFSETELDRQGIHPVFGQQPVRFILDRFIVTHLEEHANQLDKLAGL